MTHPQQHFAPPQRVHRFAAAALATAWLWSAPAMAQTTSLTITSWGGAYGHGVQEAMIKPYGAKSGLKMLSEDFNGGLAEVRAQVQTGNVKWDVVDLEMAEVLRGCDEGLFEKIEHTKLPKGDDGTPAQEDFQSGMLTPCAVATITYANVLAYDKAKLGKAPPSQLEDFFDLKKFPGKRGMKKEPQVNLEWALMADGVASDKVYEVLSTPAGVARAFKKLDTIKPHIVWWTAGAQPPQLLASGEVAMSTVYHGRIYDAKVKDGKDFALIWDGQVVVPNLFVVVKGGKNVAAAMDFVRFATSTQPLANETRYIPYAPVRKSSLKLLDDKLKPWLPGPTQQGRMIQTNAAWWSDHADELNHRFAAWLSK